MVANRMCTYISDMLDTSCCAILQAALDKAEPGMTIVISSGVYNEALKTKVGTTG